MINTQVIKQQIEKQQAARDKYTAHLPVLVELKQKMSVYGSDEDFRKIVESLEELCDVRLDLVVVDGEMSVGEFVGRVLSHTQSDLPKISDYSRKQALEDGYLVDVSSMAKEAGFVFPVAVTRSVWADMIQPSEQDAKCWGQDWEGRMWDVLSILRYRIQGGAKSPELDFKVIIQIGGENQLVNFRGVCGPGDYLEPVITIMLPGES